MLSVPQLALLLDADIALASARHRRHEYAYLVVGGATATEHAANLCCLYRRVSHQF